jgi:hypothetical protein
MGSEIPGLKLGPTKSKPKIQENSSEAFRLISG